MKAKIITLAFALAAVLYLRFFVDFKTALHLEGLTDEGPNTAEAAHDTAP